MYSNSKSVNSVLTNNVATVESNLSKSTLELLEQFRSLPEGSYTRDESLKILSRHPTELSDAEVSSFLREVLDQNPTSRLDDLNALTLADGTHLLTAYFRQ